MLRYVNFIFKKPCFLSLSSLSKIFKLIYKKSILFLNYPNQLFSSILDYSSDSVTFINII